MKKTSLPSQFGLASLELLLFLVVFAVLGILFFALWEKPSPTKTYTPPVVISPTTKDFLSKENLEEANLQVTHFPTTTPIPADWGDPALETVAKDLNQVEPEINLLDQLESDLALPEVDFSD